MILKIDRMNMSSPIVTEQLSYYYDFSQ